jgi:hypothetical protein
MLMSHVLGSSKPYASGGGVADNPNNEAFERFTIGEIQSGLSYGVIGQFPDMPPSVAIGSGDWDWGEDQLFVVGHGPGKMHIFHAQNLSSQGSPENVSAILDPANLIMDGETVVGLNMEAWFDSMSTNSLLVGYKSVAMNSFDQEPIPGGITTSTQAVWFESPGGYWVAATKSQFVMPLDLEYGVQVDAVFIQLTPNYYLRTERDAEVVARMVLGDLDFCIQSPGATKFNTCVPFFIPPESQVQSPLLADVVSAQSDPKEEGGSGSRNCDGEFAFDLASARSTRDQDINACKAQNFDNLEGVAGVSLGCCAGGAIACPPHGCVLAALGCAILGVNGATAVLYFCFQGADDGLLAETYRLLADYLECCSDNDCNATDFPQ